LVLPFVAFSLLAWAATASAECAWILWSNLSSPDNPAAPRGGAWSVVGSSYTCSAVEKDVCERTAIQHTKSWTDAAGYHYREKYLCLPDTVDPRGPKGK
jgi:hypothetical protein